MIEKTPTTRADLEALIANAVPESLHLDYKDSRALSKKWPGELSKDVSAFANADGGVIVYGIREANQLPSAIDDGCDNAQVTRERIEHYLRSNIAPRLEGIAIHRIPLSETHSAFVIEVPKSYRPPHQDRETKKYYRRLNFESVAMEDYELNDLRARARSVAPLVTFDIETRSSALFLFVISNPGEVAAHDVQFTFSKQLTWDQDPPGIITKGIRILPPGREYRAFYGVSYDVLNETAGRVIDFDVEVSYFHPTLKQRLAEVTSVDLNDYLGTWPAEAATKDLENAIEKGLAAVRDQLKRVADFLNEISTVAQPSGLQLSTNSLESLSAAVGGQGRVAKRSLTGETPDFYVETLSIDRRLASAIWRHFREKAPGRLDAIPGITPDVIARMNELFILPASSAQSASDPPNSG